MGLYGSMLCSFAGQMIDVEIYDMLPLVNSGYDITKDRNGNANSIKIVQGILQNIKPNVVTISQGNTVTILTGNAWLQSSDEAGKYLKSEGIVFKLISLNPWKKEGDFCYYEIEQVVGDDGTLTNSPDFNTGKADYT